MEVIGYLEELEMQVLAREAPGSVCRERPRARGEGSVQTSGERLSREVASVKRPWGQEMPRENLVQRRETRQRE